MGNTKLVQKINSEDRQIETKRSLADLILGREPVIVYDLNDLDTGMNFNELNPVIVNHGSGSEIADVVRWHGRYVFEDFEFQEDIDRICFFMKDKMPRRLIITYATSLDQRSPEIEIPGFSTPLDYYKQTSDLSKIPQDTAIYVVDMEKIYFNDIEVLFSQSELEYSYNIREKNKERKEQELGKRTSKSFQQPDYPLGLIAKIVRCTPKIEALWGDPNRNDDLERVIYEINIKLLPEFHERGYSLLSLDLYGPTHRMQDKPMSPSIPNWLLPGEKIKINGPLCRGDTILWNQHELTEVPDSVKDLPSSFGRRKMRHRYSSIKKVNMYEHYTPEDEKLFPSLTIRTATLAAAPIWSTSVEPLKK